MAGEPQSRMSNYRAFRVLVLVGYLLFGFNSSAQIPGFRSPIDQSWSIGADDLRAFDEWAGLTHGKNISPVDPTLVDIVSHWKGANGKTVRLVVRQPNPVKRKRTLTFGPIASSDDATPKFEAAIDAARREQVGILRIAPGTYNFRSVSSLRRAHVAMENLQDLTIEGGGARFNFHTDAPGIHIQQSQRIRVEKLKLSYAIRLSSLGTIKNGPTGKILEIDDRFPVNSGDQIRQMVEIGDGALTFVPGGARMLFPPHGSKQVTLIAPQIYSSSGFASLRTGTRFLVLHHYYGAPAVKIDGYRGSEQTEDITLSEVTIHGAPGVGVAVTGLKRGFAMLDSEIIPEPTGENPGSVEWDGIHVTLAGGDVQIARNRISGQADDAININNPVHTISEVDRISRSLLLSGSARFIAVGDRLAFFDEEGKFGGVAVVSKPPRLIREQLFLVSFESIPASVTSKGVARNIDLLSSRFDVSDNVIEDCSCHGLLAQIPNGRIERNVFRRINRNAIRLLSNVGTWKEGVGAFNVVVKENQIIDTGFDTAMDVPWAAITVYSGAAGGVMSRHLFNEDIEISDNTMLGVRQHCVTVANTRRARLRGNRCEFASDAVAAKPLVVVRSIGVVSE